MLMAVNVHIAASSLTRAGFVLATAASVSVGMNLSLDMSILLRRASGAAFTIAGLYGIVHKAADSANWLHYSHPVYYAALYNQELEMMYFLIAPLFERAGAINVQSASDEEIVNLIIRMIR